ncbi:SdpI family protein, partial [Pseudonocardia pini]|uniref:SdpI family protein n=1 Tax=Pseudonocardia pini TaxID=2758030 RepID=UPI0015F055B1
MPTTLRLVLAVLFLLAGLALVAVAVLGARSRLRRNRWLGVRTASTLASAASWVSANRVAAPPLGAAGA